LKEPNSLPNESPSSRALTFCIVGGGFSGVAVAWQLLNTLQKPATIALISKEVQIGRGLAYGTSSPHHLLNVPAGRMGICPQDEQGFLHYLRQMGLPFSGGDFVPRSLYSAYLEHSLGEARATGASRGVELVIHNATATGIRTWSPQGHAIQLDNGISLEAKTVILALGNFAPRPPLVQPGLTWSEPGLHSSAWEPAGLAVAGAQDEVLLLGSGLTAFDVLLQLRHQGHRGRVTMLSRRGLLAKSHRALETLPPRGIVGSDFLAGIVSLREMLRATRALIRSTTDNGHDWRDVIGGLRSLTPELWQRLSEADKRRFLRHLLPYWDTHRHRAAVPIGKAIAQELTGGSLQLIAGRLHALNPTGGLWRADIGLRGTDGICQQDYAAVVNCTGPSSNLKASKDTLIQSMLQDGLLCQDALQLGVEVDADYQLLNRERGSQTGLHYVGPLLKASLWEATAVPELRMHAAQLVARVRRRLRD